MSAEVAAPGPARREPAPRESAPREPDTSRDTLLLYCPYDRKVTRHMRRGPDNTIVCVECGRRLEVTHTQRTAQIVPVSRPAPGAHNSQRAARRRAGRRRAATPWLPFLLVAVVTSGALFALMTSFGFMANPFASPPQDRSAIAATDNSAVAAQEAQPAAAEGPGAPSTASAATIADVKIANTGGTGVFLRRTPNMADRIRAWGDGTAMKVIGPDTTENGMTWKHVKDPAGNEGWVPVEYTSPTS